MAFDLIANGGFGSGKKGNLTVSSAGTVINSYAQVTAVNGYKITVGNISSPDDFIVGNEVLFHCSAYSGSTETWASRGQWVVASIKAVEGDVLTLSKKVGTHSDCVNYFFQLVTLSHYKTITINENATLTCPQFDKSKGYGGILAFKCSAELKLNGGHIDLKDKGLNDITLYEHGLPENEPNDSILRVSAGFENGYTRTRLTINYPNGACFIMAKKFTCHEDSRIGTPTISGVARQQYSYSGKYFKDHIGGSSILIAANSIVDFSPAIISKQTANAASNARGYGRCYIATETVLPNDEGLYALDRISDSERLTRVFNIKSFGDGSDGSKTNLTTQLNNYAVVTALDSSRKVLTLGTKTTDGFAKFKDGGLVMIHLTQKDNVQYAGRFILANVISYSLNKLTIDTPVPNNFWYTKYYMQVVTIPQFSSFTLSKVNWATPKFENGCGGILALAVSETCNLSGGQLKTYQRGGAPAYGENGLNYLSNAQMAEKLPLGEGNGSVFILANNLTLNSSTRIGAHWTGNFNGGPVAYAAGHSNEANYTINMTYQRFEGGDYDVSSTQGVRPQTKMSSNGYVTAFGQTGGGKVPGKHDTHNGGFGSNSADGACQGAHILIVANKITGFNIAALSTGGEGGSKGSENLKTNYKTLAGSHGGCGFGGSGGAMTYKANENLVYLGGNGGYLGGGSGYSNNGNWVSGGGSGGFAFVYCNN